MTTKIFAIVLIGLMASFFACITPSFAETSDSTSPNEPIVWPQHEERKPPENVPKKKSASSKIKVFAEPEIWMKENAYEASKKYIKEGVRNTGEDDSIHVSAGFGGRIGVWFPTRTEKVLLGASFGYINGPRGRFRLRSSYSSTYYGGPIDFYIKSDDKVNFFRILLEFQKGFPLSNRFDFRLRGGVGMARGEIEEHSLYYPFSPQTLKNTWVGTTWEGGPSLAFIGKKITVELGVVYAIFPTMEITDELNEFKWNPTGFRLGVTF